MASETLQLLKQNQRQRGGDRTYRGDPQTPNLTQQIHWRQPSPRRQHREEKWRQKEPSENEIKTKIS